MTNRALPFSNIAPGVTSTEVTLPAVLAGYDRISIGGEFNPGSITTFIAPGSGTPEESITFENSSFGVTSVLSTGNPVVLQFQGVNCTATVPVSLLSSISVIAAGDGTGLPSGTPAGDGSITMEAVDPLFTPADEPNCIAAFDSADAVLSPSFEVASQVGSNKLLPASGLTVPVIDPVSGALHFQGSHGAILETTLTSPTLYSFWVIESWDSTAIASTMVGQDGYNNFNGVIRGGSPLDRRSWNGTNIYWNGQTDGSGGLVVQNNFDQFFENDGATSLLTQSNFWMVVEGNNSDPNGTGAKSIFCAFDGTNYSRAGNAKLLYVSFHSTKPSDADIQRMQGFAAWLVNDRLAVAPSTRLPTDHPYVSTRPPISGGGLSSGITVVVPSLTITIKNAPTGAALNIWDDEDANASADHGTLLFNATPDGTDKIWNSGLTPGNRVVIQWVPASPYLFKEINFPYVIPNNSVEFDLTPLLIAEDGI